MKYTITSDTIEGVRKQSSMPDYMTKAWALAVMYIVSNASIAHTINSVLITCSLAHRRHLRSLPPPSHNLETRNLQQTILIKVDKNNSSDEETQYLMVTGIESSNLFREIQNHDLERCSTWHDLLRTSNGIDPDTPLPLVQLYVTDHRNNSRIPCFIFGYYQHHLVNVFGVSIFLDDVLGNRKLLAKTLQRSTYFCRKTIALSIRFPRPNAQQKARFVSMH